MFYKFKFFYVVAFFATFASLAIKAQELELLSEDSFIAPPEAENVNVELSLGVDTSYDGVTATNAENLLGELDFDAPVSATVAKTDKIVQESKENVEAMKTAEIEVDEVLISKAALEDVDRVLSKFEDDELFSKMSELEKESALLSLQLKREKIQNDIEAVVQQRKEALSQEQQRKEALIEKKRQAAQNNQKALLVEQQKLKDKEIAFEKLRQEKLLMDYKEKMLSDKQQNLLDTKSLYAKLKEKDAQASKALNDIKEKFLEVKTAVDGANAKTLEVKKKKEKEISALKSQVAAMQAQLMASKAKNPFGDGKSGVDGEEYDGEKLENVYAIMEIRGKNNKLIAKLLNKYGQSFLAQVGTELQTGHVVEEITETYLKAGIGDQVDYIYFASGGILDKEPNAASAGKADKKVAPRQSAAPELVKPSRSFNVYTG